MSQEHPSLSATHLGDWLTEATAAMRAADLYFGHGTDNALDEACWLATHVLGLPMDRGRLDRGRLLTSDEQVALNERLAQRIESRQPLAYLIGEAWFAQLSFQVTPDVLVPRSPLAELILDNDCPWVDLSQVRRAIDVGTGSGCIAGALAYHWPQMQVDAIDISEAAVALAESSIERLGVSDRVRVWVSDVWSEVPPEPYDLIVSNPPYVPRSSMASLPEEYHQEPVLGLEAGEEGLDVVLRLLSQASRYLSPGGVLVCEVGEASSAMDQWAVAHRLALVWLDFERGGEGVFLVTREALIDAGIDPIDEHKSVQ